VARVASMRQQVWGPASPIPLLPLLHLLSLLAGYAQGCKGSFCYGSKWLGVQAGRGSVGSIRRHGSRHGNPCRTASACASTLGTSR
jgi:hypothetical protein